MNKQNNDGFQIIQLFLISIFALGLVGIVSKITDDPYREVIESEQN